MPQSPLVSENKNVKGKKEKQRYIKGYFTLYTEENFMKINLNALAQCKHETRMYVSPTAKNNRII